MRIDLKEAKKELREAWLPDEKCYIGSNGYCNYLVIYEDRTILCTNEANSKLPMRGIIGIQFVGGDSWYVSGEEFDTNGNRIPMVEPESWLEDDAGQNR